jgi:hypothetical protein
LYAEIPPHIIKSIFFSNKLFIGQIKILIDQKLQAVIKQQ